MEMRLYLCAAIATRLANLLDFPNFRNLYAFERRLSFEISCPVFGISGQRFAEFAVDLCNATRQLRKVDLERLRDILVLVHLWWHPMTVWGAIEARF
jgi:hypothetical protein